MSPSLDVTDQEVSRFPRVVIPHMLGVSDRGGTNLGSPITPKSVLLSAQPYCVSSLG